MEETLLIEEQGTEDRKAAFAETIGLMIIALYAAATSGLSYYATEFVKPSVVPGQLITFSGFIMSGIVTITFCIVAYYTGRYAFGKSETEFSIAQPWLQLAHQEKPMLQCWAAWAVHLTGLIVGVWTGAAALNGAWQFPERGSIFLLAAGIAALSFIWILLNTGASIMRGRS